MQILFSSYVPKEQTQVPILLAEDEQGTKRVGNKTTGSKLHQTTNNPSKRRNPSLRYILRDISNFLLKHTEKPDNFPINIILS